MSRRKVHPWVVVGILWVIALLNYLDRLAITTMRSSIKADVPMDDAQFGLLTAVFLWIYALVSPLGGYLADRFSRTRVIIGSLVVWSAVTWLTGHATSFGQLLAARSLMGISEAFYIPAALALIADYHGQSTRSLATGIHMSGLYAGAALGGLGGLLADLHGWRMTFSILGWVGLAYALLPLFLLKDTPREVPEQASEQAQAPLGPLLRELVAQPVFWRFMGYNSLLAIAFWGINGWLPTFLQERFHLGQGQAGMNATIFIQGASFLGILLGGTLADRWSKTQPRARILLPAGAFLVAGPFLFFAVSTPVLVAALACLVVFGLARGFYDANLMPALCQVVDARCRATAYGVLNLAGGVSGGLMVLAGGWLKDHHIGLETPFRFAALGLVIASVLLLGVRPRPSADPS